MMYDKQRKQEISADLPRLRSLPLLEQLRDRGVAMKHVPLFAIDMMAEAAAEITRLDEAILRIVSQDATVSITNGRVNVEYSPEFTPAQREAVEAAIAHGKTVDASWRYTLREIRELMQ